MTETGPSPSDAGLPPVQQVALEAIRTLRALLDLAEVAVTDAELRAQLASLGRHAWEAALSPEQRATLLATIATLAGALGDREASPE